MGPLRAGGMRPPIVVALAVAALLAGAAAAPARTQAPKAIVGTGGADHLVGTRGADRIDGRGGADRIEGRAGADVLVGGRGYDRLNGGRGADVIRARDSGPDVIDCGPGRDVAYVDRAEDGVYGCERVVPPTSGQRREAAR